MDGKAGEAGEGDPVAEVDVYVHWVNGLRCGREKQTADGRRYVCMHIVEEGKVCSGTDRRDKKVFDAARCKGCWAEGCKIGDWCWQGDLVAYQDVSAY